MPTTPNMLTMKLMSDEALPVSPSCCDSNMFTMYGRMALCNVANKMKAAQNEKTDDSPTVKSAMAATNASAIMMFVNKRGVTFLLAFTQMNGPRAVNAAVTAKK